MQLIEGQSFDMNKWIRNIYQPGLPLGEDGRRVTGSASHIELARKSAAEGMVLLKNDGNMLPFEAGTSVALLGKGCVDYVKGGGGSGDVTCEYAKSVYDGLKEKELEGKVSIFEPLVDYYKSEIETQYMEGYDPGMTREPEIPEDLIKQAAEFADTAVITISRYSGEGWDRLASVSESDALWTEALELARRQAEVFPTGDFNLTAEERMMVETAKANFSKVAVVLNIGGTMETAWIAEDDAITSALLAWQGGMEGGRAVADILCGDNYPSGKLADTFPRRLEDYPSTEGFHESQDYVEYTEDVYVGYRYFETVAGAAGKVIYPFGYGLSYGAFKLEVTACNLNDDAVSIDVHVTNVGTRAGKEVVQLYYGAPDGLLGKPAKALGAFAKTEELEPGEGQVVTLEMSTDSMASYDDMGKVQKSAWVLEAGEYRFYVGNNVRDAECISDTLTLADNRITEQLAEKIAPSQLHKRMLSDGSYVELETSEYEADKSVLKRMKNKEIEGVIPHERFVPMLRRHISPNRELIEVAEGKLSLDEFMDELSLDDMINLLGGQRNVGLSNTYGIGNLPQFGIPNITTADGPAGLRILPHIGVNTTAWPCSTMLACSFNPEMVEKIGNAVAIEVKENNIGVWLAPAVNIHRSPLCGRNFEYYSEDPLLAGKIGAGMVKGVQSQKIGSTVKHFAFNNKETNRKNSDSRLSERAAREIYLKAFEIIVKEADPWCIMTSYNLVNGIQCSEHPELLNGILREEWGYNGLVMTDWWNSGEQYLEIKAGNDLKMANGYPDRVREAYDMGEISLDEIRCAVKNVLTLILKME